MNKLLKYFQTFHIISENSIYGKKFDLFRIVRFGGSLP